MEKRVFRNFRYTECDDFAAFLSKMASEGWHFKEWNLGLIFEKGEPEDVTYSVEVFVKGSEMDLKATKDTEEYAEYCKEAGWEYVEANKKFVVFKKINEDAVDIVTQEERFRDAVNAEIKVAVTALISSFLLFFWYLSQFLFDGFCYSIFSNGMFVTIVLLGIMAVSSLCKLIVFILWYKKNKIKILRGEEIVFGIGEKKQRKRSLREKIGVIGMELFLIFVYGLESDSGMIMIIVLFVGLFLFCVCFIQYLRPNKVAHTISLLGISIMVPLALFMFIIMNPIGDNIYPDKNKAPLLQEDYRDVEAPFMQVQLDESENYFGAIRSYYITYYEYNENPDDEIWDHLDYTVIESEYDWIIERSYRTITADKIILKESSEEWGSLEAIQMEGYPDTFYVKYEDQILMLDHERTLTQEQIDIIRNKLKLGQVM